MGFAATGDAYCLRGDLALQGITNCVKVVDDILLFDSDLPTHLRRVFQMLSRCRAHGITLNKDKFMVAATNVSFCGYNISPEGIAADPEKVAAIRDYPTPSNIRDLRSFMGLVNQLADFSPEIAATAQPLRPLMSPKRSFTWTPDHDQAFGKVKAALLSPPVLGAIDFPKPILSVTHVNRCAQQMPASAMSSPTTARTYFLQHFSDVLVFKTDLQTTPLKKMSGPPMRIHLQPGATPFAIHTPRPIPFAYRDQVKEELDSLMLSRCRAHGITLNKDKFMVAATNVSFCGYNISPEGIAADPEKVAAT
ncbi:hypothetical protein C7M84_009327 [Penaeus vannamei]|uniref:RNA-directed DNA polymerase n=1 Tax=Penaeus vannamei TaxID=6689 RepID=A0A423T769_PENVA|nr:hypothetical protein C7M84_009327 [Penaeus vannamei]